MIMTGQYCKNPAWRPRQPPAGRKFRTEKRSKVATGPADSDGSAPFGRGSVKHLIGQLVADPVASILKYRSARRFRGLAIVVRLSQTGGHGAASDSIA